MRSTAKLIIAVYFILFGSAFAAEFDKMLPVRAAITGYILPNFERLAEQTEQLATSLDTLCTSPDIVNLNAAQDDFRLSLLIWTRLEFLKFGPLAENNRLERMLFWPDRKGIGLRQIQRVIAKQDASLKDAAKISSKSIALQGFSALEYLLFGKGHETLSQNTGEYRCSYAAAVSKNIHSIAKQIFAEWSNSDGFSKQWLSPEKSNPLYYDEDEALSQLVGAIAQAFELIRDLRLKPIWLKVDPNVNYKRAIFWRSEMTFPIIKSNFQGLKTLIDVSGLVSTLPEDMRWIGGSLEYSFSNANKTFAMITLPLKQAVHDPGHAENITYLIVLARTMQTLVGDQLVTALDLPTSFSALDGDG
jgi:predicted lipoprotein